MSRLFTFILFLPTFLLAQDITDPCFSITDVYSQMQTENPAISKNFVAGWNMFGFSCSEAMDAAEAFNPIVDNVTIVKDNNGSVYMPEFGFNGIGLLQGGEGYQIKMTNTVYDFSFCESVIYPIIEGCTDCEAVNFNAMATVDDDSCIYPGCTDELACNYDVLANTDDGSCEHPEIGYDCGGNIIAQVGDEFQGGIIFYIDEEGHYGLVAAKEDIEVGTSESLEYGFEWGCMDILLQGAYGQVLGSGLQNTLEIVSLGCETESGTITAAQAALDYESNGFSDWCLPSRFELELMYSMKNVIGGFSINPPYWSSSISTQTNIIYDDLALFVYFHNGYTGGASGLTTRYSLNRVRPIRAFGDWTEGCIDELASNYNLEANLSDGSCEYVYGCTDNQADNYNYEANAEDGSCIYYGCTNLIAVNYNETANIDDNSCLLGGCTNSTSGNFNPNAGINDGTCVIYGCMLSGFPNFNSVATIDDGSCDITSADIYGCTDESTWTYQELANIDNGTCCDTPLPEIGDFAQGGIVFYIDDTGQHGLVASLSDLEEQYQWGCYGEFVSGSGLSIGSGYQNTMNIVSQGCDISSSFDGITAAQATLDYDNGVYIDWYLPSINELLEMYNSIGHGGAQGNIGSFATHDDHGRYWSSSHNGELNAKHVNFRTGKIHLQ